MSSRTLSGTPAAVAGIPAQFLTFWLGEEVLGMDIRTVREIIQCGPMATVPLMPEFLRGVINLRGSVVPVIDLNARFGRPASQLGKKSCMCGATSFAASARWAAALSSCWTRTGRWMCRRWPSSARVPRKWPPERA
jgi:CheW-like domain